MRNSAAYAISEWPDTETILASLKQLVSQPMRPLKREGMAAVMRYFENHCPRSRALTTEASHYIPGGVQHNLAFNYPFPIAIAKAQDAWLWDVDGNRYIDFLQAGAPYKSRTLVTKSSGTWVTLFMSYPLRLLVLLHLC